MDALKSGRDVYARTCVHSSGRQNGRFVIISNRWRHANQRLPAHQTRLRAENTSFSPRRRSGRPPAKHSSPDYVQMSVYVHKDVRSKVKVRLFETGGEFSALVESLLRDWLAMKK